MTLTIWKIWIFTKLVYSTRHMRRPRVLGYLTNIHSMYQTMTQKDSKALKSEMHASRVQWLLADLRSHGTSHIVTADSSGMATSLTTTVNLFFGSRIMVPETGVIMNNEMAGTYHHLTALSFTFPKINQSPLTRLLRPQHLQRIRLLPLPRQLHPPPKTPPLLNLPPHNLPHHQQHPLRRPRRLRRLPHHNNRHPKRPQHPRPRHERARSVKAAEIA